MAEIQARTWQKQLLITTLNSGWPACLAVDAACKGMAESVIGVARSSVCQLINEHMKKINRLRPLAPSTDRLHRLART